MRIGKLKKMLNLWEKNELISKEQNENISQFMKERQRENFFRLLKWLSIIGALWVIVGAIITIINFFELDFMEKITEFVVACFHNIVEFVSLYIILPVHKLVYLLVKENYGYFYWGMFSLILFFVFNWLSRKVKPDKEIEKLNLSDEQKNILKANFVFDTIAAVSLAAAFCLFNMLIIPHDGYYSKDKIFPVIDVAGAITFITLAYRQAKAMYLIFGIYFVALSSGMFFGYDYACYWIGSSRPVVQILVGIILIMAGYITELKYTDNAVKEKFASIYNWTGLLTVFIALWIASFWGFDFGSKSIDIQLWSANLLFVGASLAAMYYGAKTEHNIFFNYGLTFLIIESYTVFCSHLWDKMPVGIASLLLGCMMIATGKIVKKTYLKKTTAKKDT